MSSRIFQNTIIEAFSPALTVPPSSLHCLKVRYSHVKIEEVAKAVATGLAAGVMGQSIINSGMDFGLSFGVGPSFNHWNRDQRLI